MCEIWTVSKLYLCIIHRARERIENVKIGIDVNDGVIEREREMSKRERDEKKDEGGKEKRVKMDWVSELQETFAILKEAKEKVKKMKKGDFNGV